MSRGALLNGRYLLGELLEEGPVPGYEAQDLLLGGARRVRVLPGGVPPARLDLPALRVRHPNLEAATEAAPILQGPPALVGQVALVGELLEGRSLAALAAEARGGEGPGAEGQGGEGWGRTLLRAARGALHALEALHALGLAHGELSPERLLLLPGGGVKLLDLALAALAPAAEPSPYQAPEVLAGAAPDGRADLFALGASLYEAAAGRLPDRPQPVPLRELRPELPAGLDRALQTLLDEDPRARAELGPVREALAAAEPGGAGARASTPIPATIEPSFVDRTEAIEAVDTAFQEAQALAAAGRAAREEARGAAAAPPLLVVHAPEGLGKSRLLMEAASRLARGGARVLLGRGFEGGDPYACWRPLIARVAPEVRAEHLARRAQEAVAYHADLEPEARHEHVTRLLELLAAQQPLALLLDDAQFLDPASADLLLHLARAAASPDTRGALAIVLAQRPLADGEPSPVQRALEAPLAPAHRLLPLHELSEADARALVASMVPGAADEAERLVRLGGGSPFLLVELAREWHLGGGTPASVLEAVSARLERASPEARRLLEGMAAGGRPLPAGCLTRLGVAPEALEGALGELVGLGILEADGAEPAFRFRHGVIRRIVLEALGEDQLEGRSAAALAALEADPAATPGERARLALQARSPDAVERALAAAAEDPAPEDLYQAALELLDPGPARAEVGQRLALRLIERGEFGEARRALEVARLDLGEAPAPLEEARVCLGLARVASAEGDTHQALSWAARGRQLLEACEPEGDGRGAAGAGQVLAELFATEAQVATVRGDHSGAARLYARAKDSLAGVDDLAAVGRLHLREATALVLSLDRTRYPEARARIEEAREILRAREGDRGELEALRVLGNMGWYSGDTDEAAACFEEALTIAERRANLTLQAGLLNNLGMVRQAQGDLRPASTCLERALDIAERIGQPAVLCRAYTNVGRVRRALGDLKGAERSFLRAARVARDSGDPMIESAALSELGGTRLDDRRLRSALRALRRSRRLRLRLGDVGRVATSELELGELWRSAGDVRAALGATARALALQAALGDTEGVATAAEALEFAVGRPGGPAALLPAARRGLAARAPAGPVGRGLARGRRMAELALRTLAAAIAARAGDAEQAAAHAEQAGRILARIEGSGLADGVKALARALALEAGAVVAAARGEPAAALARVEEALEAAGPAGVRRGALLLKRAFLCLALSDGAGAAETLAAAGEDARSRAAGLLSGPLQERRAVGRALLAAGCWRAGAEVAVEPAPISLAEAQGIARRLGDVSLLALVAAARAEEAAAAGSPQEASMERAEARIAAGRLAAGLPAALRRGLERAAAPVAEEDPAAPPAPGADQDLLLAMISRVLNTGLELDPLLEASLDALLEASGARRGLLALRGAGKDLEFRVARGINRETVAAHAAFAATRAVVDHVAREGIPVLLEDGTEGRFARGRGTPRSVLAAPIKAVGGGSDALLGVVYLDHPTRRASFGPAERTLVQAFAGRLGGPLEVSLRRAARMGELSRLAEAYRETARELGGGEASTRLVGRSPVMRTIHRLIERYGSTSAPVTIHGESGTGKELVARALHQASPRRDGPFIVLNCTAIAETLLESELFGVIKGAFTGADQDRKGLFELAHQGTLFLDEVGDMSLDMQAKLLRVLETGELRPVGGRQVIEVDVRIVSATHHDLHTLVGEGRFREDLLYRLNVLRVELPPLRERREDVVLLCDHFLDLAAARDGQRKRLGPEALELLMQHPFPGNVRELRNVLERASVLEPGELIGPERLHLDPADAARGGAPAPAPDYHKTFQFQGVPLNRRQRRLLDHLGGGVAAITNREYCTLIGVSERTGLRDLSHLVDSGILTRVGRRKGARYELRSSS